MNTKDVLSLSCTKKGPDYNISLPESQFQLRSCLGYPFKGTKAVKASKFFLEINGKKELHIHL